MKLKVRIANLIIAIMIALFATGAAFAWFTAQDFTLPINGATVGAYFRDGTGAPDDPFSIGNATQFFNFVWLQNTGKFDKDNPTSADGLYYFDLEPYEKNEIDMSSVVVAPVGNAKYPFNDIFDGKGYTISNLVVSTNKSVLRDAPAGEDYQFANSVGMFGSTGEKSEIKNFILNNPTVEVYKPTDAENSSEHPYYSPETTTDPQAVGLAIGYVANKAQSIGVIGGRLAVRERNYKTVNSIIGSISETVLNDQNITGGGELGTGGSGSAFGASFDFDDILSRLYKIYVGKYGKEYIKNDEVLAKNNGLPTVDNSSSEPVPGKGEKLPFSIVPENEAEPTKGSIYSGDNARELIADNNVGYIMGNQIKHKSGTLTFGEKLVEPDGFWDNPNAYGSALADSNKKTPSDSKHVPAWLYKNVWDGNYDTNNTTYVPARGFLPLTENEFNSLPETIKSIIPDVPAGKTISQDYAGIRPSQQYNNPTTAGSQGLTDSNTAWDYHGQISWLGKTYGNDVANGTSGGVLLPNTGIWFKPSQTGIVRIVMYTDDSGAGFTLLKIKRENATPSNPFYNNPTENGSDVTITTVCKEKLPAYVLFYFEYTLTAQEIEDNNIDFYILGPEGDSNGATFLYLDMGASATDTESDTNYADPEKAITAIDFIYEGVTITQEQITTEGKTINIGSFVKNDNTLYAETGAMLSFSGSGAIVCFYYRKDDDVGTFIAAYYTTDSDTKLVTSKEKKEIIINPNGNDITIEENYNEPMWVPS